MIWAPVAQLDRASASGVEGRGFESRRVYHFSKIPVKNPKTAYASKLARRFFIFHRFRLLRTRGIFYGGLPSLRSGSLRAYALASNPAGCTSFFCKINTKNHRKNQKTQDCKQDLLLSFFIFAWSQLFTTDVIFFMGCLRCAPALGFASSNHAGCTSFFLQDKHKKSPHDWSQLFATDVIFLWVAFAALRLSASPRRITPGKLRAVSGK